MAEFPDSESGYVVCTRCKGDGAGCGLAQIPEIREECSTMQCLKVASAIECAEADASIQPPKLPWMSAEI